MTKKTTRTSKTRAFGTPVGTPYTVQAQAARGFAAAGNNQPANLLVLVTNAITGKAVTDLAQGDFQVINHLSIPGALCGFSGQIVLFNNVGTGAYHFTIKPKDCNWVSGDYLGQVMVAQGLASGQAAFKLSI